jgi:hypothetical protein
MTRFELNDLDGDDEPGGTRNAPEHINRRSKAAFVPKRARRNRSNEAAKRGMHQRRNKRAAW